MNWQDYYAWLQRFVDAIAHRKGVREDLRPDAVQEAAMAIIETKQNQVITNPDAYAKGIAYHKVIDQFRQSIAEQEKFKPMDDSELESHFARVHIPDPSDYSEMWLELGRLPESSRELVLRLCLYGCTQREVARGAGLPLTTSFEVLEKALRQIRQALAEAWLEGKVTNYQGGPLKAVTIDLRRLPGATLKPQRTDVAGKFTFALRKSGAYLLRARKKGYRQHEEHVRVPVGETTTKDIQLSNIREGKGVPAGGLQ